VKTGDPEPDAPGDAAEPATVQPGAGEFKPNM
jgi:hypothetical protein